ncbi:tyrosine-type recombinase/integrase [Turicibacter sanguinis]|uniref:tyrosine-type recombinase/integrase n=1 Tax=Turicibacter sanguinis TaxID=154288 RepID=UPI0018AA0F15|nr:site-specific integrase [Turicibacter sanguinis]MDB8552268.1 site-specific integrase [Turicibacter sanguinis]
MKGSVRKRGEKWSYYFSYKQDGKYKKKEKGGFRTKKEAETALRDVLQQYEKKGFIHKNTTYTLKEFAEYWYENVAINSFRYNTLTQYDYLLKKHIFPEIGFIKLTNITPDILQKFFSGKQKKYSNNTVSSIKKVLNNIFKLAVKQMIMPYNPLSQLELKKKQEESEIKVISPEELERILSSIKDEIYYLPFLIASQVGGRRGEILGLTWDNVDFKNQTITFEKQLIAKVGLSPQLSPLKTASSKRTILMTRKLIAALQEEQKNQASKKEFYQNFYQDHNFICCHEDGSPISPRGLTAKAARLSKEFNIDLQFHSLRHTHATMLLNAGVNIKIIQERLGHSNITTTLGTYSHVTKEGEKNAIQLFEDKFNN